MKRHFRVPLLFISLFPWIANAAGDNAVLHGRIVDVLNGHQTACTVTITDARGKIVSETDSFRNGFRCSGEFTKTLPAGSTHIRITRGFETQAIDRQLDLVAGETRELTFSLERVVNLRQRQWYAGDSHVHMLHGERTVPVSFDDLALAARAEDLQYMSVAQAWNIDGPTPERLEAQLRSRSTPECLLTWNLEAPKNYYQGDAGHCLGHCWNAGLRGRTRAGADVIQMLLDASAWDYESSKPAYANFESHQLIHEQGGVACYSHPARWWMGPWGGQGGYPKQDRMRVSNMAVELPLDTLLGPTYDGLDVITGPGEFEANARAFELWCLLLNHGYRVAATGSSDSCFDRPGGGVPGTPRTYTFVNGKFSIEKAAKAIASGRTFVTTGPLLLASLDGKPPGTEFVCGTKTHRLCVEAWASGRSPDNLQQLEVLRRGKPWRVCELDSKAGCIRTQFDLVEHETAWYCVRASGPGSQTAISGAFYFVDKAFRPVQPLKAQVFAKVVDARNGAPLQAVLTEVVMSGTASLPGKRHHLGAGVGKISIPGTARLRAEAPGYVPVTLSPFLDNSEMVKTVTGFGAEDLCNWQSFESLGRQLERVELVFRLEKSK